MHLVKFDDVDDNESSVQNDIAVRSDQSAVYDEQHGADHVEDSDFTLGIEEECNQNKNRAA